MSQGFVVRTKLNRPPVPPDLVPRERLAKLLAANPKRCFTLVSAPAGYGKSTLVSAWVEVADRPAVWLSLDREESGVREFLRYVVAAVRTHSPRACRRTHGLLGAAELPSPTVLGDYLADDLEAIRRPFMLVLDDYHHVKDQGVHDLLDQVLRRPFHSFHLVLVTRHDPPLSLPGLRARGWAFEIREQDLKFTPDETRAVLETVGGISIGDDTLSLLQDRLEGWIVGLRLICLMLRHQSDPEDFLRHLEGATSSAQEYLVEEVLKHVPPEFRECLLRTSLLTRFSAPLCAAVCGREAAAESFSGEEFLRDLEAANLFAIRLDHRGEWYRYHHVFQSLLYRQLELSVDAGEIEALHLKASRWLASEGHVEESIEHALKARNAEFAADVVEANRLEILNADRWPVLAGWLERLPEEIVWERPELLLGEAWLAYYRFRIPALARIISRLDELLAGDDARPAWKGELGMFKAYLCYWEGRVKEMLAHVAVARESLPDTHDLMRADTEIYFGLAHHMAGQERMAIEALTNRLKEHPEQKGLLGTRRVITLAFINTLSGGLKEGAVYSRQLGEMAKASSPVYIRSWSTYLSGCCHFQAGEWEEAARCFAWIEENRYVSHTAAVMSSLTGLGVAQYFLGKLSEAREAGRRLLDHAVETKDPANLAIAESGHARIGLLTGEAVGGCPSHDPAGMATAFLFLEAPPVTHCRCLVGRGNRADLAEAVRALDLLLAETRSIHNTFHVIDLLALKAVACQALGRTGDAEETILEALTLASPGGFVRLFVELGGPMASLLTSVSRKGRKGQIERLIGAFAPSTGSPPPIADPVHFDPLTNRELEVLELLAERLYDKEIAARLFISMATVKTHLRHIYEKLAVGNRRQAVVKAEQLGLLSKR